jgi:hypothetical protein
MFKLKPSDRLDRWKSFRYSLNEFSIGKAIELTNELWAACPFTPFYLDPENPNSWPDPWTLLEENYYCDLAKVLGIIYTLHLCNHGADLRPELRIYINTKTRHTYHIAYLCDGKYVLNLIEGEILNKEHINQELKLRYRYTAADLKLEQY